MRKSVAVLMIGLAAALCLSGPAAAQQVDESAYNDYPPRWVGYAVHPVGAMLDLAAVKPLTFVVCSIPWLFGVSAQECPQERATTFGE